MTTIPTTATRALRHRLHKQQLPRPKFHPIANRLRRWKSGDTNCDTKSNTSTPKTYSSSTAIAKRNTSGAGISTASGCGLGNVRDQMLPSYNAIERSSNTEELKLYQHCTKPHTVSIIGAPMTYGQPFMGTDSGPAMLREAGLRTKLTALGWRVEDLPDLNFEQFIHEHTIHLNNDDNTINNNHNNHNQARNSILVGKGAEMIANMVYDRAKLGRFPLVLGGDHSVAIGSLAGILKARPRTGVLWIDAHADLNTPDISESGNMHGMPVGLLMEQQHNNNNNNYMNTGLNHNNAVIDNIPGLEWLAAQDEKLRPDSIAYVGLRDVDLEERRVIRELGIAAFTMTDIDRHGIGAVMDMALSHLLKDDPTRPIHLSYDIDAIDPGLAPATGTAVRGGLTFREAHFVAEAAAQSGLLASADLVELNPQLADPMGAMKTTELGLQIITSLMGKSII